MHWPPSADSRARLGPKHQQLTFALDKPTVQNECVVPFSFSDLLKQVGSPEAALPIRQRKLDAESETFSALHRHYIGLRSRALTSSYPAKVCAPIDRGHCYRGLAETPFLSL